MTELPAKAHSDIDEAVEAAIDSSVDAEPEAADSTSEAELAIALRSRDGNRTGGARDADTVAATIRELVRDHALTPELAQWIVEGRLTLRSALALGRARDSAGPSSGAWRIAVIGIALAAVAATGFYVWQSWIAHSEVAHDVFARAVQRDDGAANRLAAISPLLRVERDASGAVVRISGPQPRAVLEGYCFATAACAATPQAQVAPSTADPTLRLGVFYAVGNPALRRTIAIRRDERSRRWVAGDGTSLSVTDAGAVTTGS